MALSRHVNAEQILKESKDKGIKHRTAHHLTNSNQVTVHHTTGARYASRYGSLSLPKYKIPTDGIGEEVAVQLIRDELSLDGVPGLNLASFVQTWMPPAVDKLMLENISKNLIDQDEYPATQDIHTRCISILAELWNAPSHHHAVGTATTGSSEAIQLGGLAMKRIWQEKRKAAGKSIHEPGPNIIMGANAQVALEKFARYFEVEARLVPVSVESKYRLDTKKLLEYVDENTIGVYVILGSTYTGAYEPVKEVADLLDEFEKQTGISVPIHVDGASGAFVAPFATPKLEWDFRIPRVVSINTSGHKFGLTYVGVGWIIFRSEKYLPKDLIFELHYLGSVEYSFSLNFSRPAHPIIAQYFNFLHLGFRGFREVALTNLKNARTLSRALEKTGFFTVLSDIHRPVGGTGSVSTTSAHPVDEEDVELYEPGLSVVAFRFSDNFQKKYPNIQQKWLQTLLRVKQWIVPNYDLPPSLSDVDILRVVVKENCTEVLVDRLVCDIVEIIEDLVKKDSPMHALAILGDHRATPSSHEKTHGRIEEVEGQKKSGTYSKTC